MPAKGSQRPSPKRRMQVPLSNKLVIASKTPQRETRKLCLQLRKVFDPDCLTSLKEVSPKFKECLRVADAYEISHFVIISSRQIEIGQRPSGPTYTFTIKEYKDNFKECPPEIYAKPVLITFDGKSELRCLFERFGRREPEFRRVLHFAFEGDDVYVRHYRTILKDTDENFVMGMKEIGPRLTLQLTKTETGFFPGRR